MMHRTMVVGGAILLLMTLAVHAGILLPLPEWLTRIGAIVGALTLVVGVARIEAKKAASKPPAGRGQA